MNGSSSVILEIGCSMATYDNSTPCESVAPSHVDDIPVQVLVSCMNREVLLDSESVRGSLKSVSYHHFARPFGKSPQSKVSASNGHASHNIE